MLNGGNERQNGNAIARQRAIFRPKLFFVIIAISSKYQIVNPEFTAQLCLQGYGVEQGVGLFLLLGGCCYDFKSGSVGYATFYAAFVANDLTQ